MPDIERLKQALRNADAAGDVAAARKLADAIRQQLQAGAAPAATAATPQVSKLQALGYGAAQGASLGFSEELGAARDTAARRFLPNFLDLFPSNRRLVTAEGEPISVERDTRPIGEIFSEEVGRRRERLQAAREQHPGAFLTGELAGGLVTGVGGAGRAVAGQTLRQAAPRLAAGGAGLGGLAGAGYGEGLEGRASGAAVGALTGAALAPAIPAVSAAAMRAGGDIASRMGYRGAQKFAESAARKDVLRELHRAGLSTRDAERMLAENPHMLLADLTKGTQELTESIVQQPGRGGEELAEALTQRAEGTFDRIMPMIQERLGGAARNYDEVHQLISKRMREEARPLYAEAYETPVRFTSEIQELLNRPSVKAAWKEAITDAADEGVSPEQLGVIRGELKIARPTGTMVDPSRTNQLNMMRLDYTIRNLQRKAQNLRVSAPGEARRYSNLARALTEAVEEQNPVFKKARHVWKGGVADQEAMELGRRIFTDDADVIRRTLKGMSDSEREHFMVGAVRAIENRLGKKVDTADMFRELRRTPHGREVMRTLAGSEENFNKFLKLADAETRMHETFRKATGGSPTARRLSKLGDTAESAGVLLGILLQQHLGFAGLPFLVRKLSRRGAEALARSDEMKRDATARLLMQRDPSQLLMMLQGSPLRVGGASSAAGLLGAREAGQIAGMLEEEER